MRVGVHSIHKELELLPLIQGDGYVQAPIWPGMGAVHRSLHYMVLHPGSETYPISHSTSEAVFYIAQGEGSINDLDKNEGYQLTEGAVIFVTPTTPYVIKAIGKEPLICIGGPCPPDPKIYQQAGLSNKNQGGV